ncbi:hypothetical protein [Pseudonocardia sp. T1-2H]|uniref:hypothetical protein n=1 Tax=Pseudonocardia sp. T1-2H TaxID=3128899 RepID=UPI0031011776
MLAFVGRAWRWARVVRRYRADVDAGLIEIEPLDVVRELLAERLDKAGGDGLRSGGQPDRTDVDGRA